MRRPRIRLWVALGATCGPLLLAAPSAQSPGAAPAMAAIAAGDFWMGRTRLWLMDEIGWQIRDRYDDRPVHRVSLDAFSMDQHEVTSGDYAAFVKATGATAPYHWGAAEPQPAKAGLPVYNVSWHEAAAYCAWRGARLPTEAEWEKAARGGVPDLDYPWGNEYEPEEGAPATPSTTEVTATPALSPARPARAKHAHSESASGPRPVGSFDPNGFGLYDMSGNVWEWVSDWYDLYYYGVSPIQNPRGPEQGRYKVIRGGSWADTDPRLGAVYFRNYTAPDERTPTIGFRCAR
jgi:formylglycine-generating enzyme required for sulfatase activity